MWLAKLLCPEDSLGKNTGVGCMPSSRGSSWNRMEPMSMKSPALVGELFTTSSTRKVPSIHIHTEKCICNTYVTHVYMCMYVYILYIIYNIHIQLYTVIIMHLIIYYKLYIYTVFMYIMCMFVVWNYWKKIISEIIRRISVSVCHLLP